MRLLLDTHIFLWVVAGSRLLKPNARKTIQNAEEVFISSASIWEVAIKVRLGKLEANPESLVAAISATLKLSQHLVRQRRVEVRRHLHFTFQNAELDRPPLRRQRRDANQRLAIAAKNDVFAGRGFIDKLGQSGLGFVDVYGFHDYYGKKSRPSLV